MGFLWLLAERISFWFQLLLSQVFGKCILFTRAQLRWKVIRRPDCQELLPLFRTTLSQQFDRTVEVSTEFCGCAWLKAFFIDADTMVIGQNIFDKLDDLKRSCAFDNLNKYYQDTKHLNKILQVSHSVLSALLYVLACHLQVLFFTYVQSASVRIQAQLEDAQLQALNENNPKDVKDARKRYKVIMRCLDTFKSWRDPAKQIQTWVAENAGRKLKSKSLLGVFKVCGV